MTRTGTPSRCSGNSSRPLESASTCTSITQSPSAVRAVPMPETYGRARRSLECLFLTSVANAWVATLASLRVREWPAARHCPRSSLRHVTPSQQISPPRSLEATFTCQGGYIVTCDRVLTSRSRGTRPFPCAGAAGDTGRRHRPRARHLGQRLSPRGTENTCIAGRNPMHSPATAIPGRARPIGSVGAGRQQAGHRSRDVRPVMPDEHRAIIRYRRDGTQQPQPSLMPRRGRRPGNGSTGVASPRERG
jgi:hypothetical protein